MTTYTELKADAVAARTRWEEANGVIDACRSVEDRMELTEAAWEALVELDGYCTTLYEMETAANFVRI